MVVRAWRSPQIWLTELASGTRPNSLISLSCTRSFVGDRCCPVHPKASVSQFFPSLSTLLPSLFRPSSVCSRSSWFCRKFQMGLSLRSMPCLSSPPQASFRMDSSNQLGSSMDHCRDPLAPARRRSSSFGTWCRATDTTCGMAAWFTWFAQIAFESQSCKWTRLQRARCAAS